ncbi:hypothetical protein JKF63_01991 [Porcisia hertigi]|uniref:FHA domain-containing protein n=1 Tax=Porcisia hertigi TaxID=2761500 RepID=A0A836IBL0_9TRYP|nr:hypothetical protein JKF63_01991 [Porcisia hertigi]
MVYALVAQGRSYPLQTGKNVIGRSSVPVEGVSFINLESPLAAISRMQAILDVGPNGDAWVTDCNSTNGTFISIRPGPGTRLEANRYYQLSPGCRLLFGDVECTFETLHEASPRLEHLARSLDSPSRPTSKLDTLGAVKDRTDTSAKGNAVKYSSKHTTAHRSDVPYLDESRSLSLEPVASGEPRPNGKTTRHEEAAMPPTSLPLKRSKVESAASSSGPKSKSAPTANTKNTASALAPRPLVCLSGMESDERAAVTKRVREVKGRVVDDVTKANILIVATPPVRTPKFIIAVALGLPVVSVEYLRDKKTELDDPREHIVSLKTDKHTYTAATLKKVIYRSDTSPLLQGVTFNIAALSPKTKSVAATIIVSSGGKVVRAKKGDGISLTDAHLDSLYDSILRGTVADTLRKE